MTDVFASYNQQDKLLIVPIYERLKRLGLDVFMDITIGVGENFAQIADAHVRAAKTVIVFWTPRSTRSGWVTAECMVAYDQKKLVPVWLEKCDLQLPFTSLNTEDLSKWDGNPDYPGWRRTLEAVGDRLGIGGLPSVDELMWRLERLIGKAAAARSIQEHTSLLELAASAKRQLAPFATRGAAQLAAVEAAQQRIGESLEEMEREHLWRRFEHMTKAPIDQLHGDFLRKLVDETAKLARWGERNPADERSAGVPELAERIGAAYATTAALRIRARIFGRKLLAADARKLIEGHSDLPDKVVAAIKLTGLSDVTDPGRQDGVGLVFQALATKFRLAPLGERLAVGGAGVAAAGAILWLVLVVTPSTFVWQQDQQAWANASTLQDFRRLSVGALTNDVKQRAAERIKVLDSLAFAAAQDAGDADLFLNYQRDFPSGKGAGAAQEWLSARKLGGQSKASFAALAASGNFDAMRDLIRYFPASEEAARFKTTFDTERKRRWTALDQTDAEQLKAFADLFPDSSETSQIGVLVASAEAVVELERLIAANASSEQLSEFVENHAGTPAADRANQIMLDRLLSEAEEMPDVRQAIAKLDRYLSAPNATEGDRARTAKRQRELQLILDPGSEDWNGERRTEQLAAWLQTYGDAEEAASARRLLTKFAVEEAMQGYTVDSAQLAALKAPAPTPAMLQQVLDGLYGKAGKSPSFDRIDYLVIDDLSDNQAYQTFLNDLVATVEAIEQGLGRAGGLSDDDDSYDNRTSGAFAQKIQTILGSALAAKINRLVDKSFEYSTTDSSLPGPESFVAMIDWVRKWHSPPFNASVASYFRSLRNGERNSALSGGLEVAYCAPATASSPANRRKAALDALLKADPALEERVLERTINPAPSDSGVDPQTLFVSLAPALQKLTLRAYPHASARIVGTSEKTVVLAEFRGEGSSPFINLQRTAVPGYSGGWAFVHAPEGFRGWVNLSDTMLVTNEEGGIDGAAVPRMVHTCFVVQRGVWRVVSQDLVDPWDY